MQRRPSHVGTVRGVLGVLALLTRPQLVFSWSWLHLPNSPQGSVRVPCSASSSLVLTGIPRWVRRQECSVLGQGLVTAHAVLLSMPQGTGVPGPPLLAWLRRHRTLLPRLRVPEVLRSSGQHPAVSP